jgi:hypothetical protein
MTMTSPVRRAALAAILTFLAACAADAPLADTTAALAGGAPPRTLVVGPRVLDTPWPATAIAIADFDDDGNRDLAAACPAGGVVLLLGKGGGGFEPARRVDAGSAPRGLVAADFDRDGTTDLATLDDTGVRVLLSNGDGTFEPARHLAVGIDPGAIVAGDFDGDGKPDLAVANRGSGDVSVLRGHGDGSFAPARAYRAVPGASLLAAADVDGDGRIDLVAAGPRGGRVTLAGKGDGTFLPGPVVGPVDGAITTALAAADLDGDGKADLVIATQARDVDTLAIVPAKGGGSTVPIEGPGLPPAIAIADLDGDGKLDLAVGVARGSVVLPLFGNGDGTFRGGEAYGVQRAPSAIAAADLDADGAVDVVAVSDFAAGISVLGGKGDRTFRGERDVLAARQPQRVATGDLDRDGRPDVIVTDGGATGRFTVMLGDGEGRLRRGFEGSLGWGDARARIAAVDLNGDGVLDLVSAYRALVMIGNGDGTFRERRPFSKAPAYALAVGDLDGDGKPDLAIVPEGARRIDRLHNRGDGTFEPPRPIDLDALPTDVAAADLDGDGKLDLAVTTDAGLELLWGTGGGAFTPAQHVAAKGASIAVADLDGDGRPDLVVAGGPTATPLLNHGGRVFRPAARVPVGSGITGSDSGVTVHDERIAIRDLDGDGVPDLLVQGWPMTVCLGKGDGTFRPPRSLHVGGDFFTVADLDRDGLPDVIATQRDNRFVRLLLDASSEPQPSGGGPARAPATPPVAHAPGSGPLAHARGSE